LSANVPSEHAGLKTDVPKGPLRRKAGRWTSAWRTVIPVVQSDKPIEPTGRFRNTPPVRSDGGNPAIDTGLPTKARSARRSRCPPSKNFRSHLCMVPIRSTNWVCGNAAHIVLEVLELPKRSSGRKMAEVLSRGQMRGILDTAFRDTPVRVLGIDVGNCQCLVLLEFWWYRQTP